jgi:hypothetical protein
LIKTDLLESERNGKQYSGKEVRVRIMDGNFDAYDVKSELHLIKPNTHLAGLRGCPDNIRDLPNGTA